MKDTFRAPFSHYNLVSQESSGMPSAARRKQPKVPAQKKKLYEGKAKIVYATSDKDLVIQHFKDDATAFNALKRGTIEGKGVVNNKMSSTLFELLGKKGISTHWVARLNDRDMLVKKLDIVKVEVVVRNVYAGSLAKRLGVEEGVPLKSPILEFYYKDDALGDPLVNEYHIAALKLATPRELKQIADLALKVNKVLKPFFDRKGVILVDFKLEFGRHKGKIILGDEISPDTCRFWDKKTREKLDKDRFRRDLGNVEGAYQEMLKRVGA
jgi:phosphoribosylaminoimidazole-succinocarboxamide synthase